MNNNNNPTDAVNDASWVAKYHNLRLMLNDFLNRLEIPEQAIALHEKAKLDASGTMPMFLAEPYLLRAVKEIIEIDATSYLVEEGDGREEDVKLHEEFRRRQQAMSDWYKDRISHWLALGYDPSRLADEDEAQKAG